MTNENLVVGPILITAAGEVLGKVIATAGVAIISLVMRIYLDFRISFVYNLILASLRFVNSCNYNNCSDDGAFDANSVMTAWFHMILLPWLL